MLASSIVLFNRGLEEYVGAEASEWAFRAIHSLSRRKLLENGLAHLLDEALNLVVLGRRKVYSSLLDSEIPPDLSCGACQICARNALKECALLQTQSLTTIIKGVIFAIMLSIALQANLHFELQNAEPNTASTAI